MSRGQCFGSNAEKGAPERCGLGGDATSRVADIPYIDQLPGRGIIKHIGADGIVKIYCDDVDARPIGILHQIDIRHCPLRVIAEGERIPYLWR